MPGNGNTVFSFMTHHKASQLKSVERVDLLPYHKYGTVKYGQRGRIYQLNVQPPDMQHMNNLKSIFEHYGLRMQVGS
jgi:pyruvate formate lyase activating enzyme